MTATAILAGGCFWCVEHDLRGLPGVLEVVSGYTGGTTDDPTYYGVASEATQLAPTEHPSDRRSLFGKDVRAGLSDERDSSQCVHGLSSVAPCGILLGVAGPWRYTA